jgi:hypothetical protein
MWNFFCLISLTLNLITTTTVAPPSNASNSFVEYSTERGTLGHVIVIVFDEIH